MNFLERAFSMARRSISSIIKDGDVYSCSLTGCDNVLLRSISDLNFKEISIGSGIIENTFLDSISIIPQYEFAGEYRTRTDVLLRMARGLNYFSFAGKNGSIYISTISHKDGDIEAEYCKINELFNKVFGCGISFSKVMDEEYFPVLDRRINDTYKFYVEERGDWIERFMSRLGDDISRDSYAVFLKQRIMASIFDDSPICYPVLPPAKTASWRQMRESQKYDFPVLRGLDQEILEKIFFKCLYIYEQYAIQGIVEAQKDDTVIDVGAFIGDSACYFSNKVGNNGKVLCFEISPDSIKFAKENIRINKCQNVQIIQAALSDKIGYLPLLLNSGDTSSNAVLENTTSSKASTTEVRSITLDEFCKDTKEKVDFIKADIEGSEMSMLRGAKHTISTFAPKCAICLYHKKNDFWEIPEYLGEACPDYSFWFRCESEPVLFAKRLR